jgi:antitoxin MazE
MRNYNVITSGEAMKARLVRIGNSQGIRIPKPLLEQAGLRDEVEIEVEGNRLVIFPLHHPRAGWDEAFQAMARQGDDALLDSGELVPTQWDEEEWEWR